MNTQQSATPFQRPDHKAKRHGKPVKWRRAERRHEDVAREMEVRCE